MHLIISQCATTFHRGFLSRFFCLMSLLKSISGCLLVSAKYLLVFSKYLFMGILCLFPQHICKIVLRLYLGPCAVAVRSNQPHRSFMFLYYVKDCFYVFIYFSFPAQILLNVCFNVSVDCFYCFPILTKILFFGSPLWCKILFCGSLF